MVGSAGFEPTPLSSKDSMLPSYIQLPMLYLIIDTVLMIYNYVSVTTLGLHTHFLIKSGVYLMLNSNSKRVKA